MKSYLTKRNAIYPLGLRPFSLTSKNELYISIAVKLEKCKPSPRLLQRKGDQLRCHYNDIDSIYKQ